MLVWIVLDSKPDHRKGNAGRFLLPGLIYWHESELEGLVFILVFGKHPSASRTKVEKVKI